MGNKLKVTEANHLPGTGDGRFPVYSKHLNAVIDELNEGDYGINEAIVAATGSTQATGVLLDEEYNVIATCATAGDSVTLPVPDSAGVRRVIINLGAAACDVFPAVGGSINDESANTAVSVPAEGSLELISTSTTQWEGVGQINNVGETLTAVNTLNEAQSGSTLFLNSATEFATTLPAPALGLKYKFVIAAAPSGAAYTVVTASSANIIEGTVIVNGASVAAANEDTITFADGVAVVGDWVEVVSDGTSWFISGVGQAAASITITQAS
jgi:hypothetical protein